MSFVCDKNSLEGEVWKDVIGYEGYYQVSDKGRVRCIARNIKNPHGRSSISENIMSFHKDKRGYSRVSLSKRGKGNTIMVHRLVAKAFLPNHENLPCVNHKNEIHSDNRVENLEWCDYKYNNNYGTRKRRISQIMGLAVEQIDKTTGNVIAKYHAAREAMRVTGIAHVDACCRGVRETAGGYKWRYAINGE